ncbi:MAG TPA: arylesterase, partial [Gemmatirosa sp.]|nr:arylesterase [Gemmatirosa sp.]
MSAAALTGALGCERAGARDGSPAGAAQRATPGAAGEYDTPQTDARGASAPATTRRPRVVFLGTSLTAGLGVDPDSAYPAVIARLADSAGTPITVVNAGQSGETSAGALRRVEWVLREPADILVLETGANDGLRGQSPDSLRANLQAIVERARARQPGLPILILRMEALPNLGPGYTARFRRAYDEVARATDVALGPFLLEGVAGVAAMNQPDGVHPNPV